MKMIFTYLLIGINKAKICLLLRAYIHCYQTDLRKQTPDLMKHCCIAQVFRMAVYGPIADFARLLPKSTHLLSKLHAYRFL